MRGRNCMESKDKRIGLPAFLVFETIFFHFFVFIIKYFRHTKGIKNNTIPFIHHSTSEREHHRQNWSPLCTPQIWVHFFPAPRLLLSWFWSADSLVLLFFYVHFMTCFTIPHCLWDGAMLTHVNICHFHHCMVLFYCVKTQFIFLFWPWRLRQLCMYYSEGCLCEHPCACLLVAMCVNILRSCWVWGCVLISPSQDVAKLPYSSCLQMANVYWTLTVSGPEETAELEEPSSLKWEADGKAGENPGMIQVVRKSSQVVDCIPGTQVDGGTPLSPS